MTAGFNEEWFGPGSCQAVKRLVESTKGLDGTVVEVGCWEGRSTVHIAHGAFPDQVQAVDTWEGSPGEISGHLAAQEGRDVFATFLDNIDNLTRGNVTPHRMGWREFFTSHRDPIRFLHIDAEHTYREVFDNIEAALPLMVPGGVICGDDAHHYPVVSAVNDLLGAYERDASLWIWRVPDAHPNP